MKYYYDNTFNDGRVYAAYEDSNLIAGLEEDGNTLSIRIFIPPDPIESYNWLEITREEFRSTVKKFKGYEIFSQGELCKLGCLFCHKKILK